MSRQGITSVGHVVDAAMSVQLNHTIVWCRDQHVSAPFLCELFGLPTPARFGPFLVVEVANGVSLDYHDTDEAIAPQHYAFLVERGRLRRDLRPDHGRRRSTTGPIPAARGPGTINRNDGGRGVYFKDPDGHLLEIITRPYGSGDD